MNNPKHSLEQAMEIQKEFERRVLPSAKGILGIGIGMNRSASDFALNVQVVTKEDLNELPKEFDGLELVVDVVGSNEGY